MSRYIEYDAIDYRNDKMHDKSEEFLNGVVYMAERIEEAPSIDIVRCKECKFSESVITSWSTDGKNNVVERLCKVHKWSVKDDDFCSYGQKR